MLRIPLATYRLQFNRQFRFRDAQRLLPYLQDLGITDVYASPLLKARAGSTHGYDVTDPLSLNPELGSEAAFDAVAGEIGERGLGLILDIVPNHMGASSENAWWMDVLRNGPVSPFAGFFDVDWNSTYPALAGRLLLPILDRTYGRALEDQMVSVKLEPEGLYAFYYDHKLPLRPASWSHVLAHRLDKFRRQLGATNPAFRELRRLLVQLASDPAPGVRASAEDARRVRDRLWRLYQESPDLAAFLNENLELFQGEKNDPHSFDALDRLLDDQYFRLSYWKLANEQINYRRFFAVSELISVRVEEKEVFDVTHSLILRLIREGKVTGLRVDHIDGLYDPAKYLKWLHDEITGRPPAPETVRPADAFYVVVEKILGRDEELPAEWPVHGTTGYDFLNELNALFVDAAGVEKLGAACSRLAGVDTSFADLVYEKKKLIMETLFAGEMSALDSGLGRLATADRYARDLPPRELGRALLEVTACFPVYRTYIEGFDLVPRDVAVIEAAVEEARRRNPAISPLVFDFIRSLLLLDWPPHMDAEQAEERLRFVMRWQQFTGPIMAKGLEDTALYVDNRLLSFNEVGGDPERGGLAPNAFHRRMHARSVHARHALNATTTHDTKRSEDVRARLNVLSEMPEEWGQRVALWMRYNRNRKRRVLGRPVPDRNEEIHIYQTLLGAWPIDPADVPVFRERMRAYILKAAREAKVHTRWIRPQPEYESALQDFIEAILKPGGNRFLSDFLAFQKTVAYYGALNGLSQVLIKITAPGVPDFYQGSELWDLRLVDPDNRNPVDFGVRIKMLEELKAREARNDIADLLGDLQHRWQDGRVKLFTMRRALAVRNRHPDLFQVGDYLPLGAQGRRKNHVCAFARCMGPRWVIVAAPRLFTGLVNAGEPPLGPRVWAGTTLSLPAGAPNEWTNVFTGRSVRTVPLQRRRGLRLHDLFASFPVALLESATDGGSRS